MNNITYEDIVINPSPELIPKITIAPVSLQDETESANSNNIDYIPFDRKYVSYHVKCRDALYFTLRDIGLNSNDYVTILTTSGNSYVSSCVTQTIELICKWNREITDCSKVILVIHEFGYAYQNLDDLKKYNLPIIEDCAYAFFTTDAKIGKIGDYVIYSLPKIFNMQFGGLLCGKSPTKDSVTKLQKVYIDKHLYRYLPQKEHYCKVRLRNLAYLREHLHDIGIYPFFSYNAQNIPGVFLFRWYKNIDYQELKIYMQQNGVESSVFYGENAFFIPIHQNLSYKQLDYMINLLRYYYYKIYQKKIEF